MGTDAATAPPALWSYGFRPFFTLAAAWAVVTVLVLLGAALGVVAWPSGALPVARWHGHEMLFGFVAAAVAGFLLTAVPTWTGTKAIAGPPLAALAGLWLLGRAVHLPWLGLVGTPWVFVDALFFPALAVALGVPLVRKRNYRNFQFLIFLLVLAAVNAVFLATELGWLERSSFDALRFTALLVLLMIAVVGGRIVPLFTRNALLRAGQKSEIKPAPVLDISSLATLVAVVLAEAVVSASRVAGGLAAIAALLLLLRLARWQGYRTLRMPIVWILHAGYAWLAVALALKSAWLLMQAPWAANWLHALTTGAFGTMILAVMSRVALGHTGRELAVARPIVAAYLLVIAAAVLRVSVAAMPPALYVPGLIAAGGAWIAAFALFVAVYAPILLAPRADETTRRR
jgi:uncharacterized protein involved in response to NO